MRSPNMMNDNSDKTIEVNDESFVDNRPVDVPVITIERYGDKTTDSGQHGLPIKKSKKLPIILSCVLGFIILTGAVLWIKRYDFMSPGVPVSVSDAENMQLLDLPFSPSASGTKMMTDSILGVTMDFYPLQGLRASLETELPDTTDQTLVLFMRSSDYHPDGATIGTLVAAGKRQESKERKSRAAYMAISKDGKPVIGVSLSDRLADYATKTGGSFFRQYLLLSDATLPTEFYLHGKVERAAIARMNNGSLHYVVTHNKESMYDFADALREYGFVDAIYLTGGKSYTFYRDSDGNAHVPEVTKEKYTKYTDKALPAPLLVFRNAN